MAESVGQTRVCTLGDGDPDRLRLLEDGPPPRQVFSQVRVPELIETLAQRGEQSPVFERDQTLEQTLVTG